MGLVMLVVLTLLGANAMTTSSMELRMSNHAMSKVYSFNQAEQARELADARVRQLAADIEAASASGTNPFESEVDASAGIYDRRTTPGVRLNASSQAFWSTGNTAQFFEIIDGADLVGGYTIEYLGIRNLSPADRTSPAKNFHVFRVTIMGRGADGSKTISETTLVLG